MDGNDKIDSKQGVRQPVVYASAKSKEPEHDEYQINVHDSNDQWMEDSCIERLHIQ